MSEFGYGSEIQETDKQAEHKPEKNKVDTFASWGLSEAAQQAMEGLELEDGEATKVEDINGAETSEGLPKVTGQEPSVSFSDKWGLSEEAWRAIEGEESESTSR